MNDELDIYLNRISEVQDLTLLKVSSLFVSQSLP
jgi:hypothetical protein